jgi:hypothetical protein
VEGEPIMLKDKEKVNQAELLLASVENMDFVQHYPPVTQQDIDIAKIIISSSLLSHVTKLIDPDLSKDHEFDRGCVAQYEVVYMIICGLEHELRGYREIQNKFRKRERKRKKKKKK